MARCLKASIKFGVMSDAGAGRRRRVAVTVVVVEAMGEDRRRARVPFCAVLVSDRGQGVKFADWQEDR